MIYLLLITFLLMLFLTYKKFDNDIIAPPVVLVAGYTFSIICASVNVENWGIDLHINTFLVLVYGTLLFVLTGYWVKKYIQKSNTETFKSNLVNIEVNYKYLYLYIAFQILVMIIWVWGIYAVTDSLGNFDSFSERMVAFRKWNSYGTSWLDNYFYIFINQFNQISLLSPYLFLYIIIKSSFINKRNNIIVLSISIIISLIQILFNGGRLNIISLALSSCLYYCVFYYQHNGKRFLLTGKLVFKFLLIFVVGSLGFYYSKAIVGRGASDLSMANIIPYLTMYVGGPIQLLDMFLQNPIEQSWIWGKEVFSTLNFQLIRFGFFNIEPYITHLEFRTATTGAFLGNIYTAYRSYIYDFGFIGLTILPVIFSSIVNYLYYKIVYSNKSNEISFLLLFYSLIFWCIFFDFVRCFFFTTICSFRIVKQFVFLIILTSIFVKGFSIKDLIKRIYK